MKIQERLLEEMHKAQKAADKARLAAIRWIRDAIQKKAIDSRGELSQEATLEVLTNLAKRYRDSIEQAKTAGRNDLVQKEEFELKVLEEFLPSQIGRDEIEKLIEETISETGAKGPKDMGNLMKALKPKWAGRADGKEVSDLVKQKLAALNT